MSGPKFVVDVWNKDRIVLVKLSGAHITHLIPHFLRKENIDNYHIAICR